MADLVRGERGEQDRLPYEPHGISGAIGVERMEVAVPDRPPSDLDSDVLLQAVQLHLGIRRISATV